MRKGCIVILVIMIMFVCFTTAKKKRKENREKEDWLPKMKKQIRKELLNKDEEYYFSLKKVFEDEVKFNKLQEEAIVDIFEQFDLNKNGVIRKEDIASYLKSLLEESNIKFKNTYSEDFFQDYDSNGDQRIEKEELRKFISLYFNMIKSIFQENLH
jgi:Ca2+-binding EF-hand superfamily protein